MTNYFKVYLTAKSGKITKFIVKNKAEVIAILKQGKKDGFISYDVIKRIKPNTDIPIGHGSFYRECSVKFVENLETDWKVVGNMVIDRKKYKENEEKER